MLLRRCLCCRRALQAQLAAHEVQLVLLGAAADGRDLRIPSSSSRDDSGGNASSASASASASSGSTNCTATAFSVLLSAANSRPGSFAARLLFASGASLALPQQLAVVQPPLLSVTASRVSVPADQRSFAVGVQLSKPAPAGGVAVQLRLGDDGTLAVRERADMWPAASSRCSTCVVAAATKQCCRSALAAAPSSSRQGSMQQCRLHATASPPHVADATRAACALPAHGSAAAAAAPISRAG